MMDTVHDLFPKAKFYQASTSEMFGWVKQIPQNENTPFNPANPYAAAKLYAHNIAQIYRKSYKMFVACGILFNHESPRRGLGFVTQKVCYAAACAKLKIKTSPFLNEEGEPIFENYKVRLGNLEAKRDWGFAGDYCESMYLMLQQRKPGDFVIGTGETHTIADLCKEAFGYVGLDWRRYVVVDKRFVRPTETGPLVADASKAKKLLGWKPKTNFKALVAMLVDSNLARLK
jgi:GDPmannose 4,6-dehydratase